MTVSFVPALMEKMFSKPMGFMLFQCLELVELPPNNVLEFRPLELHDWVFEDEHRNYPVFSTPEEAFREAAIRNLKEYAQTLHMASMVKSRERNLKWCGVYLLGTPKYIVSKAEFSDVEMLSEFGMGEVYIGSNCPLVNVQANQFPHIGVAYSAKPSGEPLFSQAERYEALRAMGLTGADDLFTDERVKERATFLNEAIKGIAQPKAKKTNGKPAKPSNGRKLATAK